tara:strand:- start:1355 stop:1534 length:180 start_codon:yes stop_codon:yes gene_type:complete
LCKLFNTKDEKKTLLLEKRNVDFFYLKRKKEVKTPPFPFNKTSTKIHQNDERAQIYQNI